MATYQKTGYDKALEFDPASGIIKYGNFEFWADQVGVKPTTTEFNFDTYKKTVAAQAPTGMAGTQLPADDILRKQFADAVNSGTLNAAPAQTAAERLYGQAPSGLYSITQPRVGIASFSGVAPEADANQFRKVQQADQNTFRVETYNIPGDIEFVNRLNAQAAQLSTASAQGQTTDPSRPTPGNARLGKPNYSRAATVLAGEQAPLGGAKTTLGA